jgi:hypothetical protein
MADIHDFTTYRAGRLCAQAADQSDAVAEAMTDCMRDTAVIGGHLDNCAEALEKTAGRLGGIRAELDERRVGIQETLDALNSGDVDRMIEHRKALLAGE